MCPPGSTQQGVCPAGYVCPSPTTKLACNSKGSYCPAERAASEAHVKGDNGRLYIWADELLAQLDSTSAAGGLAPVRLLKLSWLEQRAAKIRAAPNEAARRALALPRRQELEAKHPEAFLSPAEMRALPGSGHSGSALRLIAISHGWLTPEHPDPLGEQLVAFVKQVQSERSMLPGGAADSCCCCVEWACPLAAQEVFNAFKAHPLVWGSFLLCCYPLTVGMPQGCACCCIPVCGQGWCKSLRSWPRGEAGVFYDFGSLPQKDADGKRSPAEAEAFSVALQTMGSWYAHQDATTFSMTRLPPGWDATPYGERGWCTFERAVSELVKMSASGSWRQLADPAIVRGASTSTGAYRAAPLHPEMFAARLALSVFTNGKSDCELVAKLYADTLVAALGETENLMYVSCAWGDDEVEKLAAVLRYMRSVEEIDMKANPRIGSRGFDALAAAIANGAGPKLKRVVCDQARSASTAKLRAACEARGIVVDVVDEDENLMYVSCAWMS